MKTISQKELKLVLITILTCSIYSCATTTMNPTCIFHADAQVYSDNKPLSGVTVTIYFPTERDSTRVLKATGKNDENGLFIFNLPDDCSASRDFIMTFSKTGYKTVSFRGNSKEDTIHRVNMEKAQAE